MRVQPLPAWLASGWFQLLDCLARTLRSLHRASFAAKPDRVALQFELQRLPHRTERHSGHRAVALSLDRPSFFRRQLFERLEDGFGLLVRGLLLFLNGRLACIAFAASSAEITRRHAGVQPRF